MSFDLDDEELKATRILNGVAVESNMEEEIIYYCDQCGEVFEVGDHIIETDYHIIHEECEDDYIDMMKDSWQYKTFMKGE